MKRTALLALLLVAVGVGCDSAETEADTGLNGRYSGTARVVLSGSTDEVPLPHTFSLRESENGAVEGNLTIVVGPDTYRYTVAGTRSNGTFDFHIGTSASGVDYRGTADDDGLTLRGQVDWPPGTLADYSLTVTRSGS